MRHRARILDCASAARSAPISNTGVAGMDEYALDEDATTYSIRPYPATASEDAVHRLGDPNREAANTALEPRRLLRLYQQMHMIMLNAVLQDPEPRGAGRGQCSADRDEWTIASERGDVRGGPQCHVRGAAMVMRNATPMRHVTSTWRSLSAGTAPAPAPCRQVKLELSCAARHLIEQISIIPSISCQVASWRAC